MARRKPARASKPAARKQSAVGKKRFVAAKPRRKAKKTAPKTIRRRRPAPRPRKGVAVAKRKGETQKAVRPARRTPPRPLTAKKVARTPPPVKPRPKAAAPSPNTTAMQSVAKPAAPRRRRTPVNKRTVRKSPAVQRERRTWDEGEGVVPGPPSSLDLDRTASSARSGRRDMLARYEQHTETSPALTGGDVDADWESAYSVGDEAPGGDNPTPDQDLVDDIGQAVGLVYEDNEELEGEAKVSGRDRHRWELDPASSDDFEDR